MADIVLTQGQSLPAGMQTRYKDMGDGTHAQVVSTGAELTDDGEMWITETERENDVFAVYSETGLAATKYIALVDLDNALWPHRIQGQPTDRIDVTSIYYSLDLAVNTKGQLLFGVVARINNVNADIEYFAGLPFLTGAQQADQVVSLRAVPSQVKLDLNGDTLLHGITNLREENVAAVRTGLALDSPNGAGTVNPAKGDLILKYEHSAGTTAFAVFAFYHTQ
jgi:hypothetical protein